MDPTTETTWPEDEGQPVTGTTAITVIIHQDNSWRCKGTTKQGRRCWNYHGKGEVYCWVHREKNL